MCTTSKYTATVAVKLHAKNVMVGEAVEGGGISFICLPAAGRMKAFLDALAPPTQSETA